MKQKEKQTCDDDIAFNQALQYHKNGDFESAESLYHHLLQKDPTPSRLWHLLGLIQAQQGHHQLAISFFRNALQLEKNANIYSNLGNSLKHIGDLDQAERQYRKALELQPNYATAYHNLGHLMHMQGKLQEAFTYYQKAIEQHPQYATAYYNLSLIYAAENQRDKALTCLQKAILYDPENGQAHAQIAQYDFETENYQEAITHYRQCLQQNPNHLSALIGLGASLVKTGQIEASIKYFKQALICDPHHPDAYHNLASSYLNLNQPNTALKYCLWLNQNHPSEQIHYNLGIIYMAMDRHRDAVEQFEHILKNNPHHIDALMNLGATYLQKRDTQQAQRCYRLAHKQAPDNPEIHYLLQALRDDRPQPPPICAPESYITHLFDQYAGHFDQHLQGPLRYQVPELLYQTFTTTLPLTSSLKIIDIGCGTGLCGERFQHLACELIGIDLSSQMIAMAAKKNIYNQLITDNMLSALETQQDADLIIAADVLPYLGDLDRLFDKVYQALKQQGYFAFTLEKTDEFPYTLQKTARYAHSPRYIEHIAQTPWCIEHYNNIISRYNDGQPVEAYLYLLKKET